MWNTKNTVRCVVLEGSLCSLECVFVSVCVFVRCPSAMMTILRWSISEQAAGNRGKGGGGGSSSPGHMPTTQVQRWQRPTPTPPLADVPSVAIAAVLVVAAGLVCCRPTSGQRGIQCGATGGTRASSFSFTSDLLCHPMIHRFPLKLLFSVADESVNGKNTNARATRQKHKKHLCQLLHSCCSFCGCVVTLSSVLVRLNLCCGSCGCVVTFAFTLWLLHLFPLLMHVVWSVSATVRNR